MQIKSRFEGGGKAWEMEKRPAAARLTGGCAARGEGRRRKVGDDPDRWVPPVGEREREKRAGLWWAVWAGSERWAAGKEREKRKWAAGDWVGFVFFSFFFQNLFKSFSNPF
jgi:hypothetical protein